MKGSGLMAEVEVLLIVSGRIVMQDSNTLLKVKIKENGSVNDVVLALQEEKIIKCDELHDFNYATELSEDLFLLCFDSYKSIHRHFDKYYYRFVGDLKDEIVDKIFNNAKFLQCLFKVETLSTIAHGFLYRGEQKIAREYVEKIYDMISSASSSRDLEKFYIYMPNVNVLESEMYNLGFYVFDDDCGFYNKKFSHENEYEIDVRIELIDYETSYPKIEVSFL